MNRIYIMAQYGFLVLFHKMYRWYLKATLFSKEHYALITIKNTFLSTLYISLTLNFDQETWFKVIAQLLPRSTLQQSNDMRLTGLQREKNNRIKIFHRAWQRLYTAKCATFIIYDLNCRPRNLLQIQCIPMFFKPFLNEIEPDWSREEKNSQLLVLLCPRPLTKKLCLWSQQML